MPSPGRLFALLVLSVVVSLALVLLITSRYMENMPQAEIAVRFAALVVQQDYFAVWVKDILGPIPPAWAQRLSVVWHQAQPQTWWWLPLVFIATRSLVIRGVRRRSARM
jgi:hypothetical protein